MSERTGAKAKRRDAAKLPARLTAAELDAENARLRAELQAAQARISDLEARHTEVVNRIDWVIDSLHNLPG